MGSGVGGSLLTVFALQLSINVLLMEEDTLDFQPAHSRLVEGRGKEGRGIEHTEQRVGSGSS